MKLDPKEKEIVDSVERGEWRSIPGFATFREDKRVNIRISSKDLDAIQKRALEEGLPYQTLISSLLHKYASGRLRDA
jgi:predicted DNA binding CopG/RHH family protein